MNQKNAKLHTYQPLSSNDASYFLLVSPIVPEVHEFNKLTAFSETKTNKISLALGIVSTNP